MMLLSENFKYCTNQHILKKNELMKVFFNKISGDYSNECTHILVWGRKQSAAKGSEFALTQGKKLVSIEDGFIHSLGQGVLNDPSLSLVMDDVGIYYDATMPSLLEQLILNADAVNYDVVRELIDSIILNNISKYNNGMLNVDFELQKKCVLLIDQTAGDLSLQYGYATKKTFDLMLKTALIEHADAQIIIKTHPDVVVGKKKGCFNLNNLPSNVRVISDLINPIHLLKHVDYVYVATSQIGFEALLLGKQVSCFGVPFYAGWGLTDDRADKLLPVFERRNVKRTVEQVFSAAYLDYTTYVHPDEKVPCELSDILRYFQLQYDTYCKNTGKIYCFGLSVAFWKLNYIKRFLYSPDTSVFFVKTFKEAIAKGLNRESHVLVWGQRGLDEAQYCAKYINKPIWYMEDGFIRSVGLGSDLAAPLSLVVDKRGIYFDATQSSDLEVLLETHVFSVELIQRAVKLRQRLLNYAISKYNVGKKITRSELNVSESQSIALVVGQVEGDASIAKGCLDIRTNTDLLIAARKAAPNAFILYKPHPDVISGNRQGMIALAVLRQYSDCVLDDVSITDCLEMADEVHTMTSLVGFEALMRHKTVYCYGIPFYAGWGLTQDRHVIERRTRHVSLDELVAATLILYPRYMNWETKAFTTPEFAVNTLHQQITLLGGKPINRVSKLQRFFKKLYHFYVGVFVHRS